MRNPSFEEKQVSKEEMNIAVMKYIMDDFQGQLRQIKEDLPKRDEKIFTELKGIRADFNKYIVEQAKMKKDICANEKSIKNLWTGITSIAAIVTAGLVKFFFELVSK